MKTLLLPLILLFSLHTSAQIVQEFREGDKLLGTVTVEQIDEYAFRVTLSSPNGIVPHYKKTAYFTEKGSVSVGALHYSFKKNTITYSLTGKTSSCFTPFTSLKMFVFTVEFIEGIHTIKDKKIYNKRIEIRNIYHINNQEAVYKTTIDSNLG